jgi:RNA polymerase sigma-70 factor (ECF subfamily)
MRSKNTQEKSDLLQDWSQAYRPALIRYFQKRVPNHVDLEDLAQEVFIRLANQVDLSTIQHVEGYIFRCASSVLIDFRRRSAVRFHNFHESFEENEHKTGNISLERVLEAREAVNNLIKALHDLPEKTRHIFVLYHFENFRYKDIAKRLNIGIATVERHMSKANAYLIQQVDATQ